MTQGTGTNREKRMNRVWLITGANSGFGRAITKAAVSGGDIGAATARRVTALFANITRSPAIDDYAATVGATRSMTETSNGSQPGDPAKAAAAILAALDAEETPLRLPLGDDAVDAILGHLDTVRGEVTSWEKLARGTRMAD
jgi:NAD(P)-dependent dehydrogenase (short-subunit alcohol dehydrogenase family)